MVEGALAGGAHTQRYAAAPIITQLEHYQLIQLNTSYLANESLIQKQKQILPHLLVNYTRTVTLLQDNFEQ